MLCFVVLAFCFLSVRGTPEQIHIALAGENAMNIAWYTEDQTPTSTIQYGFSPHQPFPNNVTGKQNQYLPSHGYHHDGTITNLPSNKTVYYRVGDRQGGFSTVFQFTSPKQDNLSPFAIAIFGDMGYLDSEHRPKEVNVGMSKNWTAVPSKNALEYFKEQEMIDLVWHIGDIGYADDAFPQNFFRLDYEIAYNGYMNWIQNITSTIPYMTAPGNHESEDHSPLAILWPNFNHHLRNFTAYNARWHMPSSASGGVASMWYSFDYGPVHFVSLNTETDFPGAPEENKGDSHLLPAGHFAEDGVYLKWLDEDLKKASEAREKKSGGYRNFLVVGGHRPFEQIKANGVAELFDKYGVDVYFAGHVHSYYRSLPTSEANGVDLESVVSKNHYHNAKGRTYIVSGGAGCDEMTFVGTPNGIEARPNDDELPEHPVPEGSQAFATDALTMGVLEAVNTTALHWVLYYSNNLTVADEVWITKSLPQ